MDARDFVMLGMLAVGGKIEGKTKLQKTMYFLAVLTDHLDELGYRPHFYGPYSQVVADAMDRMRTLRFVDQNICGGGATNESGFELSRYDYCLNEDGNKVSILVKKRNPGLWEELESAAAKLNSAGDLNYVKLSVAAKTYFLLGQKKGTATEGELAQLASKFGWRVTPHDVGEAAAYLNELGLVESK